MNRLQATPAKTATARPVLRLKAAIVSSEPAGKLAEAVAASSRAAILDRLTQPVHKMSVAQARGYVRARAQKVVRRETSLLLGGQQRSGPRLAAEVESLALRQVVQQIVRQELAGPRIPLGLRKAG